MRELQPETVDIFLSTPVALLYGTLFLLMYLILGRRLLTGIEGLANDICHPQGSAAQPYASNRFWGESILQAKGQEGSAAAG